MATKPRRTKEPMLYDGTRDAIRNIRERKQRLDDQGRFTQEQCAKRAHMKTRAWSDLELSKRRALRDELEAVLRGLECTEKELWEEKVRVEREHFLIRRADEVLEPSPTYGAAWGGTDVGELYALDSDELPPENRRLFNDFRNYVAEQYARAINAAVQVKTLFQNLKKDPEDPEEE